MAQFEIDIDNYLSEQEKKELVIESFKEVVKELMFNNKDGVELDHEMQRIIGNISHSIVMEEVQKYIPNCEELIKKKTLEILNESSLTYHVFKKKDAWEKEDSLAITYINETIRNHKEEFQNRIKETLASYDFHNDISDKISSEFDEMVSSFTKLSEFFYGNKKNQ